MLTIIIPAYNEASVIGECLESLLLQTYQGPLQIIVAANGCSDQTADIAKRFELSFRAKGYSLVVLDITQGNKNNALNKADAVARYGSRLYLDADVVCDNDLILQLVKELQVAEPVYASGTLCIQQGDSYASRCYGKIWKATPYIRNTVPGCGCYAVNAVGRTLWNVFPKIHSDDKFVRLLFTHRQRKQVQAKYYWPLPQGFLTLINIRTRWTRGNRQLASLHPELSVNDSKRFEWDFRFIRHIFSNPVATLIFASIYGISTLRAYQGQAHLPIIWSRAR